jgi:2-aminomuconate deaminase
MKAPSSVVHNSAAAAEPVGLYPHARQAGNTLYLSGIGPRRKGSKDIPGVTLDSAGNVVSYDIAAQFHSVVDNVRNVLAAAGFAWTDLISVTVYLTNMKDDFKTYNALWAQAFAENPPCRTTVEVNCLPTPIAIEFQCIAVKQEG